MTKNTSYHYSIIIPHKNTPRLLERCLCSIPTWDEIQIIIIDDNSNSESVDFSHFPGNGRKNTEILFTKEGKGAGYARNIGLSHARGKWIIFADADDFFTADCFTILNEYMDSPHEVIYFNVRFVMSDNPSQESRRGTYYTNFFNDVNPENKLRYQSQVPWGKMIRRSFLSTFHIQFDETRIANDVYFSCLVGIYAPKATTDRRIIYYCTESGQSLAMSKQDRESLIIRFNASMKCNRLLRQEKNPLLPVTTSVVYPFGKNKRMAPRQILF
ncbi:glycosyltransferase [Phocaeicola vulgatus]|nr:glycosyltransferase [Phocaeicola vulgatus]